MAKKEKKSFEQHYSELYGERWGSLKGALLEETTHFALCDDLEQTYYLDEASIWVANLLDVKPGDVVADMCAAPGGKSLVLARALQGQGKLVANDRSPARKMRLQKVLDTHLRAEYREIVEVKIGDASQWGLRQKDFYDKILLDAPCSSERHLLHNPKYLEEWTPNRTKNLSIQQMGLLCSALMMLKPGGELVYSTCSLSPLENQDLVERFLKKRKGAVVSIALDFTEGEAMGKGWAFLPDRTEGRGPLFCAKFKKTE